MKKVAVALLEGDNMALTVTPRQAHEFRPRSSHKTSWAHRQA